MYCAPPVCYKSEREVYGLSVMKSNFISFTLTVCTRRVSGVGVQLEVEWRCVSVFTKGVCEVDLDCDRMKLKLKC